MTLYSNMFIILFNIVFYSVLTPAYSEWVEISQHHYKKPMKPTHNHPIIATISNREEKPKGNRIYFNHSLEDHIWDNTPAPNLYPNEPNLDNSNLFHVKNVMHDQSYKITSNKGPNNKGEISIIRKVKPNQDENRRRTTAINNGAILDPKDLSRKHFLDDRKEQIEVINVSNIEHDISEFSAPSEEFEHNKTVRRKHVVNTTQIPNLKNKYNDLHKRIIFQTDEPERDNTSQMSKTNFNNDNNKQPINFKNSMRRVQIVDGKPKGHSDYSIENSRPSMTARPKPASKRNDFEVSETTISKSSNMGHTNRVEINKLNNNKLNPNAEINRYTSIELNEDYDGTTTVDDNAVRSDKTTVQYHSTTDIVDKNNKQENNHFDRPEPRKSHYRNPDDVMIEEITSDFKDMKIHRIAGLGTVKRVSPTEVVKLKRRNEAGIPIIEPPTDEGIEIEELEYNSNKRLHYKNAATSTTTSAPISNSKNYKPVANSDINNPETVGINPYKVVRPSQEPLPEFVTKQEHFEEMPSIDADEFTTEPNFSSEKYLERKTQKPERFENERTTTTTEEDPVSNESKTNAMENLIRFLKTVTDIITRNTRRGVQGKMRYLEDLRDAILANIEERIEAAFPDDVVGPKRRSRAAQEARGHVEFPSSESALMTISFLTFAVFLIKLVLQVIQAYKNKTMMVVPTVVAAVGRAYHNRHAGN